MTQDPENEWHGKVGAEYGSFNRMEGVFNVSGGLLKDTLYAGLNGQYMQNDGWIENDHPGMDEDANKAKDRRISGYLLFKPTDRLSARFTVSNDYTNDDWTEGYGLPAGSDISDFDQDDAENVDFDVPTEEEYESNSQSLNLNYNSRLSTKPK